MELKSEWNTFRITWIDRIVDKDKFNELDKFITTNEIKNVKKIIIYDKNSRAITVENLVLKIYRNPFRIKARRNNCWIPASHLFAPILDIMLKIASKLDIEIINVRE